MKVIIKIINNALVVEDLDTNEVVLEWNKTKSWFHGRILDSDNIISLYQDNGTNTFQISLSDAYQSDGTTNFTKSSFRAFCYENFKTASGGSGAVGDQEQHVFKSISDRDTYFNADLTLLKENMLIGVSTGDITTPTSEFQVWTGATQPTSYDSSLWVATSSLTREQAEILSHLSIDNEVLKSDLDFYAKTLSSNPNTLKLGNIDVNSASHGIGIKNLINNAHALANFQAYDQDGFKDGRVFKANAEFNRVVFSENTSDQPNDTYSFEFIQDQTKHELVKSISVIPIETGVLKLSILGKFNNAHALDTEIEISQSDIGNLKEIEFSSGIIFEIGDINIFEISGVKLRGGNHNYNGTDRWVPYLEMLEHYVDYGKNASQEYVNDKFNMVGGIYRLTNDVQVEGNNDMTLTFNETEFENGSTIANGGEITVSEDGYYRGNVSFYANQSSTPNLYTWLQVKRKDTSTWVNVPNSLNRNRFEYDTSRAFQVIGGLSLFEGDSFRIRMRKTSGFVSLQTISFVTDDGEIFEPSATLTFFRLFNANS